MALATFPKLKCDRCEASHVLTFYPDRSIRSSDHPDCAKPVPGPPNPPRLLDQGKFWMVATTCVGCGTKGLQVTQILTAVHRTILCDSCSAKEKAREGVADKSLSPTQGDRVATLMFLKAARHTKAAIDALESLIEAAEDAEVDGKLQVEISDAYRVIEEYKAAGYACPICGAIQEEHVCLCPVQVASE